MNQMKIVDILDASHSKLLSQIWSNITGVLNMRPSCTIARINPIYCEHSMGL